jgi:hypothetical protein
LIVVVDTNNCRLCFHEADGRRIRVFDFHSRTFPVAARVLDSGVIEVSFENGSAGKYAISELIHSVWWTSGGARLKSSMRTVSSLRRCLAPTC